MRLLRDHGLTIEAVDRDGLLTIEPASRRSRDKLAGGIFSPMRPAAASCFAQALAAWCVEHAGAPGFFGRPASGLAARVTGSPRGHRPGPVEADAFVLASGADRAWRANRRPSADLPVKGIPDRADVGGQVAPEHGRGRRGPAGRLLPTGRPAARGSLGGVRRLRPRPSAAGFPGAAAVASRAVPRGGRSTTGRSGGRASAR